MKKYASTKTAKEIIDCEKIIEQTAYFTGELSMSRMRDILLGMGFGWPETRVILAALVLSGAKFTDD